MISTWKENLPGSIGWWALLPSWQKHQICFSDSAAQCVSPRTTPQCLIHHISISGQSSFVHSCLTGRPHRTSRHDTPGKWSCLCEFKVHFFQMPGPSHRTLHSRRSSRTCKVTKWVENSTFVDAFVLCLVQFILAYVSCGEWDRRTCHMQIWGKNLTAGGCQLRV